MFYPPPSHARTRAAGQCTQIYLPLTHARARHKGPKHLPPHCVPKRWLSRAQIKQKTRVTLHLLRAIRSAHRFTRRGRKGHNSQKKNTHTSLLPTRAHALRHNTSRTVMFIKRKKQDDGQMISERSEDGRPML